MRLCHALGLLLGLVSLALAVFDDEAYVVDWQLLQVGPVTERKVLSPSRDIINILSEHNVLAGILNAEAKWRVSFDGLKEGAVQRLSPYSNGKILTGLNYPDRSVLQVWDSHEGFLVKTLRNFDGQLEEIVSLSDGSVFSVFRNGDVIIVDKNGDLKFSGSIRPINQAKVSALSNGNVIILFNEKDSNNAHVVFFDGESLSEHALSTTYDSIVDFFGSKIVFLQTKYYSIHVNGKTGKLSEVRPLPEVYKYIPLASDEYIAFEKNHHIEVINSDLEPHFTIENVHKYILKYVGSSFVLYTEFHANILDPDTGVELQSYKLEEPLNHTSVSNIYASTDGIEEIYSMIHFKNNTYYFLLNGEKQWTRSIAGEITTHAVVDLPSENTITEDEIVYEENLDIFNAYLYRIKRHLVELKGFYNYLWLLLEQWATDELPDFSKNNDRYFGFEKLLVFGTKTGKVFAVNTIDGSEKWRFNADDETIVAIENVKNQELYIFTKSGVRFILNAITGEFISKHAVSSPTSITRLSDSNDFLTEIQDGFDVILSETPEQFNNTFFVKNKKSHIQGYMIKDKKVQPTWRFDVIKDEEIVGYSAKDSKAEIANIGIILGDRSVLYKYLYPNLAAFGVLNKNTKVLYIHIIDTVTGELLHSVYHDELVHENEKFNIVFGEHWVVYSYWSNLPTPEQKIVVIDLFESLVPDNRISTSNTTSSFEPKSPPVALSKAFILPHKINKLAISETKYGITTKAILVSLTNGQIVSLPKPILNARRVEGREHTAVEKQEFMLLPYDPVISIDESNVISHERKVVMVDELISIPTNLESTSIVCAYGLDIFCTRISPSLQFDKLTQSFDYFKLMGSIVLLITAYLIMKYFNNSKKLKNAWVYE